MFQSGGSQTTANALKFRGLKLRRIIERYCPRRMTEICNEFYRVVANECRPAFSNVPFSYEKVKHLQQTLFGEYIDEVSFDFALFSSFRGCLQGFELEEDENKIVLRGKDVHDKYAVGFARQVRPEPDLIPTSKEAYLHSSQSSSTQACLEGYLQAEHAVCLFEKVGPKWTVKECFGIIELKTSETNCSEFTTSPANGDAVRSVDFVSNHGALAQVLLFTLGSTVLYHARNGILENEIPLAVIAGRRTRRWGKAKRQKTTNRLRWVSARLYCPEFSDDQFSYSVDDFGEFHDHDVSMDTESAEEAARLFLDTMLFGLKLAIRARDMRNSGFIPKPCPASGRFVRIGSQTLNVSFCASPVRDAATVAYDSNGHPWSIHQADLFRGNVNLHDLLQQPGLRIVDFRSKPIAAGQTTVLVKVSSTAVHSLLNSPSEVMLALQQVVKGKKKMLEEICSVLYAVENPSKYCLVTIMSDLSGEYQALTPAAAHANHMPALWAGFTILVKDVLLPMAETSVIHPDIRPGYDVTFNILCKLEDDGANTTVTLKLIDLENLVCVRDWQVSRL